MPIVDIPTLLLLYVALAAMVLGFLLAGAWHARTRPALWWWAGAFAAVVGSQVLRAAIEARWGGRMAFPVGHLGGLLHAAMLVLGTRAFLARAVRAGVVGGIAGVATAAAAWAVYGLGLFATWSLAISHVAGGGLLAWGAATALRERRGSRSVALLILGAVLGLSAFAQLARGLSMFAALGGVPGPWRPWADDAVSFWLLVSVVLLVAQGFAILLAVNSALQRDVRAMAEHDPMTGLLNRRGLQNRLLHDRRRGDGVRAVVLADVDHFKAVNDGHGHSVGDEVLVQVGARLARDAGPADVVARFGGEEFVLVLHAADMPSVLARADALRAGVGGEPVMTAAGPLRVTISMGTAEFPQDEPLDGAAHRADLALYRAKREGRNRVALADVA